MEKYNITYKLIKFFKRNQNAVELGMTPNVENTSKKDILEAQHQHIHGQYSEDILMIHNEFDTAADKLLIEAQGIIKESESKDIDKIKRLESLGFKQVNQVVELKPLIEKAELSKTQIELLNYYKKEYPFNKFITEEQVKTICHKYNLVCGDVTRFKGFVPEKNLKEIERFKLKEKDFIQDYAYGHINSLKEWNERFTPENRIKGGISRGGTLIYDHIFENPTVKFKPELQICAPVKDMDITGLELVEGYKLEKKHIPDPIVLQPVKGGYLILTKWGPEASDPIVTNEIDN